MNAAPRYAGEGPHALWHVSEDPTLRRFEPHLRPGHDADEPVVWAVDTRHLPLYWFPRDCPRATFWAHERTTDDDVERFLDGARDELVLAVRSEHDDRDRPFVEDPPCGLDAVESRHLDVHDREIRPLGAGELDCLLAVAGLGADLEARPLEQVPEIETDDRLVFRDEDPHGSSVAFRSRMPLKSSVDATTRSHSASRDGAIRNSISASACKASRSPSSVSSIGSTAERETQNLSWRSKVAAGIR